MGFHENLLSRKGRPKGGAAARAKKIEDELRRAKAYDLAAPPPVPDTAASTGSVEGGDAGPTGSEASLPSALPYTVRSLAERWSCSEGAVRNLVRNGGLGHCRVGDLIRIPADDVTRFECRK